MAVLVHQLQADSQFDTRVCVTGQHRQMLDQVMDFFEITADYDLEVMAPGQDLTDITVRVLAGMKVVFREKFRPDLVLVHGDTTTCLAAGLAAFYEGIEVGHVEAGLRTYNLKSPFPEEANRQLVDRISTHFFCPTEGNRINLLNEGFSESGLVVTGNTVIDALMWARDRGGSFSGKVPSQVRVFMETYPQYILVTGHRRENFGEGFLAICAALGQLAHEFPHVGILYPVHLNPHVQKPVYELLDGIPNVCLTAPLDYPDFVFAMKQSWAILTDSGGVQEEAPSLGKPVLVMRDTTERPEAVAAGTVQLVGAHAESIARGIRNLVVQPGLYEQMAASHNPYGDGKAAQRIIQYLHTRYGE